MILWVKGTPMRAALIIGLFGTLLACQAAAQDTERLFTDDGYRAGHYRAPVRQDPGHAGRIALQAAVPLVPDRDALFIDVMPAEGGNRDPVTGKWTLAEKRLSIKGAHWFPEAGRGVVRPDIAVWFERGITRLTRNRRDRMIIVFCRADCWMSWNAARRLAAGGYNNVWWLSEGTDGWTERGLPLVPLLPDR